VTPLEREKNLMLLTTLGQFAKEKKNPWGLWNAHGMFVDNINVPICKNK